MTNSTRRFAAAALAAFTPLAALSVVTAAPSAAECVEGQSTFNGSCVASSCKKSEVRDANTGECRNALSAALGRAQAPAVAQVSPQQWAQAGQILQQAGGLPDGVRATRDVFSVVNAAIDIPVSLGVLANDTAGTLYVLSQLGGGVAGTASTLTSGASAFSAAADVARSLPSPQLPKIGVPKLGVPKIGLPKLKLFQNCLPVKFVFFRPCI